MAAPLTERVWQRIKGTAQRCIASRHRPSHAEAEKLVNGIILSEDGPFPEDAVEFYARELIRLVHEGEPEVNFGTGRSL